MPRSPIKEISTRKFRRGYQWLIEWRKNSEDLIADYLSGNFAGVYTKLERSAELRQEFLDFRPRESVQPNNCDSGNNCNVEEISSDSD